MTIRLGIVGVMVGGWIGHTLGYQPGQPAGFIMAVVGAVIVLAVSIGAWHIGGVRPPVPTTEVAIAGTPMQPAIRGSLAAP